MTAVSRALTNSGTLAAAFRVLGGPRTEGSCDKLLALGAVARVERVREELELVLEIFGAMCPALPEHELTLSGWRKLDGSLRKRLQTAGYSAETTRRRGR